MTYRTLAALARATTLGCATFLLACSGKDSTGPGSSSVPQELVGQWQTAFHASPGTSDYLAGEYDINIPDIIEIQSSTVGVSYYFYADGRYEHVWIWDTVYSFACVRSLWWEERGTVSISGSSFTFNPGSATYTALDSCEPALNFQRAENARRTTLGVTREVGQNGVEQLRIRYPSGGDVVYVRP